MKTEKEKMLAGEVFNVYDPELVKERQYARQLVERFNALGRDEPDCKQYCDSSIIWTRWRKV